MAKITLCSFEFMKTFCYADVCTIYLAGFGALRENDLAVRPYDYEAASVMALAQYCTLPTSSLIALYIGKCAVHVLVRSGFM